MKYLPLLTAILCLCMSAAFAQQEDSYESKITEIRNFTADIRACDYESVRQHIEVHPKLTNLHSRDEDYDTPLVMAIEYDCLAIAKLFIENGANINYGNEVQKKYPFILAAAKHKTGGERYDWPDLLSDMAPRVLGNKTNRHGETALIAAAKKGLAENVRVIVENVPNPAINVIAADGYSARMWAAENDDIFTMQIINDADPNIKLSDIKQALAIAQKKQYLQMQNILQQVIDDAASM